MTEKSAIASTSDMMLHKKACNCEICNSWMSRDLSSDVSKWTDLSYGVTAMWPECPNKDQCSSQVLLATSMRKWPRGRPGLGDVNTYRTLLGPYLSWCGTNRNIRFFKSHEIFCVVELVSPLTRGKARMKMNQLTNKCIITMFAKWSREKASKRPFELKLDCKFLWWQLIAFSWFHLLGFIYFQRTFIECRIVIPLCIGLLASSVTCGTFIFEVLLSTN